MKVKKSLVSLTFILFFSTCIITGRDAYSQTTKLSLNLNDVSVREVLNEIENKSEVIFVFRDDDVDLDRKVSIIVNDKTIEYILDQLFQFSNNRYEIDDRQVLILKKESNDVASNNTVVEKETVVARQGVTVTGTVTEKDGPLPGASVAIKGTTMGVTTDANGQFTITAPDKESVLVFSFVGYAKQEMAVGNRIVMEIFLQETASEMEEIVVVGYGIQKKVSVTGAVSSANTKDIKVSASASIANALAGRISGLTSVQRQGGQPGRDDASMYLRGAATINGVSPLILIDGVPRDNIRTIDPNEVETISVLKDASATAVFGVRGANGVIMITTKRGKEGKPELNVTATQSFSALTREPTRLRSLDYFKYRNEAYKNDGLPTPFTPEVVAKWENPLAGLDPNAPDYAQKAAVRNYMYPDNDWYRMLINKWSPQSVVNANLTGGTDKISYFVNIGYLHQGGNLKTEPEEKLGYDPSSKLDRYSFRSNVDYKITPSFSVFMNLGTYIEIVNMPAVGEQRFEHDADLMMRNVFYHAQYVLPIAAGPYTIEGFGVEPGLLLEPAILNGDRASDISPFEIVNYRGYLNETRTNLNSSVGANWDLNFITKGLSMKAMLSFDSWAKTTIDAIRAVQLYMAYVNTATDELSYSPFASNRPVSRLSLSKRAEDQYTINAQASILYNRKFGLHDVGGMVLAQRDYWEGIKADIPFNVLGVAGRVTYNYDTRYFGELNLGYNGSEQFAPTKRYGFFPAFSAGWVVSNENFLSENNILTFLKLRASTGRVGNDQMGELRFLYMDDMTVNNNGYIGSLAEGMYISEGLLGNKNLTWELAQKYNVGVDVHIMHNLRASVDVFKENRSQILLRRESVPAFQGVEINNIPRVNMGEVENQGFEIELSYIKQPIRDMLVELRGNFGYNQNKRMNVDEVARDVTYYHQYRSTGYPIGQHWGYEIDRSQDDGYWTPNTLSDPSRVVYSFGNPRPGDFVYKDKFEDGEIDDRDMVPIGCGTIPKITWGASASVQYKGFDAYVFFQGLSQYYSTFIQHGTYEISFKGIYFPYHRTAWTEERWKNGDKISYPALSTTGNVNHRDNSFFVFNRSFWRFKNAELGYTLPAKLLNVVGVSRMRIYVSGQNIFTWSPKFKLTHLDPENDDSIGYPQTKVFSFGTNIIF